MPLDELVMGLDLQKSQPEQLTGGPDMDTVLMEIPPASKTWSMISSAKRWILRMLPLLIRDHAK